MNSIELPALSADSALGFLAAVGTLRLVTVELGDVDARLSWPNGPFAGAEIATSTMSTIEELAASIVSVVESMRAAGQLLPGVTGFPPSEDGQSSDPTSNLSLGDGRGLAASSQSSDALGAWLPAVVGIVPPIDRKTRVAGNLEKSRFFKAGPGTVWVPRTLKSVLALVDHRRCVEAFEGWRREAGFIGAYFDHRADVEKATGQRSKPPPKSGVPGATFLALMALPLLPVRTPGVFAAETVGWASTRVAPKGFAWPVWSQPLGTSSVAALMDHPAVADLVLSGRSGGVSALGLSAVFRSLRIAAGNNDAALAPAIRLWSADTIGA